MHITIDRKSTVPVYLQIRNHIREMIVSGELSVGYCLPPERKLADVLGVNRSTVLSAYRELKADNFIGSHIGRGTVVLPSNECDPSTRPNLPIQWQQFFSETAGRTREPLLRDLMELASRSDVISFAAGMAAPELFPMDVFRDIFNKIIKQYGAASLLHTPTEGHYTLRESICRLLEKRRIIANEDEVQIFSGSQQALDLTARVFIDPGDVVIVEEPTFFCALQVFQSAGARIIGIPVDNDGMQIDILEQLLARYKPKFIYTLPTFQNPSGKVMSLERRHRLLQLSYKYQVPIVEDDTYGELSYDGKRIPSLKSLDRNGYVMYVSTFSKILFPGLRIGWMAAPHTVINKFTLMKQMTDLHTNSLSQYLLAEYLSQGLLEEHIPAVCKEYIYRRDIMIEELREKMPVNIECDIPAGGLYLWCRLPDNVMMTRLIAKASEYGVAFVPGEVFCNNERYRQYLRLNFSFNSPQKIREGVQRLADAVRESIRIDKPGDVKDRIQIRPIV